MSYLVLARKWRPQRFSEVVGQTHVVRTLTNAIKADRVAHSFVFSGVRGVGKTSLARILAKSLNCAKGPTDDPCGECDSCRSIAAGTAVDVIEIDGASNNSVDDVRELRETVPYVPSVGRYKIYVIDEVHMLSTNAFNALLKTLEEPPAHVKFIFATTEAHKIPVTILSRCQRYDFRRIPTSAIVERIKKILGEEGIQADDTALALIGREAEGSMRDALSILDQVLASNEEDITADAVADLLGVVDGQVNYDISRAILDGHASSVLEIVRMVDDQGYDVPTFAKGLLNHFRNLVVAGVCHDNRAVLDLPDKEAEEIIEQATSTSVDTLHRLLKHFADAYEGIARSSHPKILLEATLARIADMGELIPATDLIKQLEGIASGKTLDRTGGSGSGGSGQGTKTSNTRATTQTTPHKKHVEQTSSKVDEEPPQTVNVIKQPNENGNLTAEYEKLKKEKPTIASILECGSPKQSEDGKGLTIRFPVEYRAVAGLASDRRADIAKCLEERLGFKVRIEIIVDETAEVPLVTSRRIEKEQQEREIEEQARNHPLVMKAQNELGASLKGIQLVSKTETPRNNNSI